ncbi:SusC/RagA family TonB-linked outer membrane protein [Filimonas lacunae]|nr:SusC/RagA family TonB-linked outer membrane protein [Filimonas lacunae]BAV08228.1 outer membrane protein, nutrient binding [Filimonas lacunae]
MMRLTTFVLLCGCLFFADKGIAQSARVTLSVKQISLEQFFNIIESQTGYRFSYSAAVIPIHKKVDIWAKNESLETLLTRTLKQLGLSHRLMSEKVIGITDTRLTAPSSIPLPPPYPQLPDTITIHGTVVDENGKPIANAAIQVRGTNKGISSAPDGTFSISLTAPAFTLDISSLNFVPRELTVSSGITRYRIMMEATAESLSEIVVVAYGTTRKGAYTGSVAQINSEKIAERSVTNVLNYIEGSAPGIQSTSSNGQPGSSPTIRIRGFGSVSASNAPLFVLDGAIYDGNISDINANDIDNFSILKDAAATALYGNKAVNGVIMISTKKGKRGQNRVQLRVNQGIYTRGMPEYNRVNAYQYYPLMWEALRNSLVYPASGTNAIPIADANQLASGVYPRFTTGANAGKQNYNGTAYSDISQLLVNNPFNVASTDIVRVDGTINPNARLLYPDDLNWYKALSRTGQRQDYTLATSGGTERRDYYISLGYNNEKGFINQSDFRRFTGRVNVNTQPLNWFKTGLNLSAAIANGNNANDELSTGFVNPFFFTRDIGPIYPVYQHNATTGAFILDNNGQKQYELGLNRASGGKAGRNVVAETALNKNIKKTNTISARSYGTITLYKGLNFTSNISVDLANLDNPTYDNKIVGDGAGDNGRASKTSSATTSYTFNQLFTYNQSFNQHHIDVLAGHENYDFNYRYSYGARSGQILENNTELINFTTTTDLTSYTYKDRTESYLSRINYDFKSKYLFSASFRRDGSSRFYQHARWGNFWSVGAGWRLDQEKYISQLKWVNMLKLRGSYGVVGNNFILNSTGDNNYYAWQALYQLNRNNALEPGYLQSSLENKDLKWETNRQLDLGVDFSLFNNRLSGTIEYFNKNSYDLLYSVPLPVSGGIDAKNMNIGTAYNRGLEVQLTGTWLQKKNFSWATTLNWTIFSNKITSQPQQEIIEETSKRMVGHSIYDYWLRQWYGVDPNDGAGLFVADKFVAGTTRINAKGDTVTTDYSNARFAYSGTAIPDFYGSISNTVAYKNFKLSFLITYQVGGKTYDAPYAYLMNTGNYGEALHTDVLRRWQKPGDITDVPRMDYSQVSNYQQQSTRYLVSSSYLNFRSATFTWAIPAKTTALLHIQDALLYITAENLGWLTARKGMNPQQAYSGLAFNAYAPARIYTLGLNITL